MAGGGTRSRMVYLGVRYEAVEGQKKEVSEIWLGPGCSHLVVGSWGRSGSGRILETQCKDSSHPQKKAPVQISWVLLSPFLRPAVYMSSSLSAWIMEGSCLPVP